MKSLMKLHPLWIALLLALLTVNRARAQGETSNVPPRVSLCWPADENFISDITLLRLRADVMPGSRPVAFVQFYANTNLIATVSNPPYATMSSTPPITGFFNLTAASR